MVSTSERADNRSFHRSWMIAVEIQQLVGMCWFSVDTSNNVTAVGSCHQNIQEWKAIVIL